MIIAKARRTDKIRAFALLELLLTLVILAAVLAVLLESISLGLFAGGENESMLVATNLAQEKMEEIRNKSYSNIANETKAAVSGFASFQREVVVTTPQTDLKQATVNVYWNNKDDELNVALVTYVSNI